MSYWFYRQRYLLLCRSCLSGLRLRIIKKTIQPRPKLTYGTITHTTPAHKSLVGLTSPARAGLPPHSGVSYYGDPKNLWRVVAVFVVPLCYAVSIIRKLVKMNNIELEIGKEYFIWTGRTFSVGTPDKVTPKWVHIIGGYRTADKWILREKITSFSKGCR